MSTGAGSSSIPLRRGVLGGLAFLCLAWGAEMLPIFAQETAIPTSPTTTPTMFPSATPTRSLRISFLPPPLEGKISLGIYNEWDQLVRILHQEADLDEFKIGADALVTKWDGKDNNGFDVPPGTYHARGYLIAPMKIEEANRAEPAEIANPAQAIHLKLVSNPLARDGRPSIELMAGIDDENAYVETKDGLPLITIAPTSDGDSAAALLQEADKSFHFIIRGKATREFKITGISKMMAFDAGNLELK